MREANFDNILRVLNRERPTRPTLFEFFLNSDLYTKLAGYERPTNRLQNIKWLAKAFHKAGYDYVTITPPPNFDFGNKNSHERKKTISLNEYHTIYDEKSFNDYQWPDAASFDYSVYDQVGSILPTGMKGIPFGPGGVLENVIKLAGYDTMCLMSIDNPNLLGKIFDGVGQALVDYYKNVVTFDSVGAIISNDDWGFNTQTMLCPADFEKFLFPWHKKIVEVGHKAGKPVILHSCGNLEKVMDNIIDNLQYDGKHSYEDNIMPVEDAYDIYHKRIAILGGIDLDFMCRKTPQEITKRAAQMLKRADKDGSYALGTGNSVPEYVPNENYFAMIEAATRSIKN
jgi:uroporphyrinogen decarboxylase